jgi:hypothetical protein
MDGFQTASLAMMAVICISNVSIFLLILLTYLKSNKEEAAAAQSPRQRGAQMYNVFAPGSGYLPPMPGTQQTPAVTLPQPPVSPQHFGDYGPPAGMRPLETARAGERS